MSNGSRFFTGNAINKNEAISELEKKQKEMLAKDKETEAAEASILNETPISFDAKPASKVTTAKLKQTSPMSIRLDAELVAAVNDLVVYEKLLKGDVKSCVNKVIATAVKEYVEKSQNLAAIKEVRKFRINK